MIEIMIKMCLIFSLIAGILGICLIFKDIDFVCDTKLEAYLGKTTSFLFILFFLLLIYFIMFYLEVV